ncbi:Stk1 family PASTA domain-containing Ser/Thr kinase [Bulleidia sp. HCP3S3_F2]|uniref:Stk1 family PASTA domain-containing Ser/Thr kinase n=1 Tax=unclassified Bulleidia TaxID=2704656 RepID=UPI002A892533|nr:Stk1 family PASTA domain-containing Ser/Thr kinase [Erysipelotrichaceae bacterium]MDD7057945.1 Stk1 family PASTA domain-containing Ser/Thr kinase [Erysipelotrichaceae bacterium]MDY3660670.1 Stk1 family PASTA domain-containing Ser/Thr kinase [Bulleidia sp.]
MTNRKNVIADRYEVVSHIGQGGMADVFLAVDTILNRQVAIKILRADLSTDAVSILRFEREAQAAAALAHPNIVEIYDVGDYKGHHYIVMEYVTGKTLKQVIRSRGPLVNEEAVDIMKQLCSAISEAHSRGIIHRDIKPQNVIVKADGSIKILDFGIATAKGSMQLTQANNVMGSVHYLAPELAKGEAASPQSDIYALGIVLYEMLAGDVPFKADQAVQIALKHMREPMPDVRLINASVPQSIANVITRATAKDPNNRYGSCREMLQDISTCLRPERLNERKLVLHENIQKQKKEQTNVKAEPARGKHTNFTSSHTYETSSHEKGKNYTKPVATIFGIVVVVGIIAALIFNFLPRNTKVPSIQGMSLQDAEKALHKANLNIDESNISYELTEDIEQGIVISSSPEEGSEVGGDTSISLVVSSGIGVTCDDFVGQNITDVKKQLNSQYPNLTVNAVSEDSMKTGGTILRQEKLQAGTLFDPSKPNEITLVYATYPTITIPDDIIGMDVQSAQRELEHMGAVVRTSNRDTTQMSQEELDSITPGVVISCDPAYGTSYTQKENNYITLYYY